MTTGKTNSIVIESFILLATSSTSIIGASLEPDHAIHHGFECTTTPCPSVTHEAHEFGTAVSAHAGGFVVGAPFENSIVSNRNTAVDAGAAFIYDGNGSVLNAITNPVPMAGDRFGAVIASSSHGGSFVGAPLKDTLSPTEMLRIDTGAAYLFDSSGSLTTTFESASPADGDGFGSAIAQLGSSTVLIGAVGVDTNAASTGIVYMFSLDGTPTREFLNPFPRVGDRFGSTITVLDSGLFVIGAPGRDSPSGIFPAKNAGSIHIYSADGLPTTGPILSPVNEPNAGFGSALATLHQDLFAVGAPGAERVFFYNAMGDSLSSITNPFLGEVSGFGGSLASVSSNRLLIGAVQEDDSNPRSGKVFLYDTSGDRLLDIEHPTGRNQPRFGWNLASIGEDNFVIGNPGSDMWETTAGSVYLYQDVSMTTQNQFGVEFDINVGIEQACGGDEGCIRPPLANIEVFGTVRWVTSGGGSAHRFVSGTPATGPTGCFDTGIIRPGQSYTGFFDDRVIGDIPYYCTIHTQEIAALKIVRNNRSDDAILVAEGVPKFFRIDSTNDVEWLKFFVSPTPALTIGTSHIGTAVDTILDIYLQLADGSLSNVAANVNDTGHNNPGEGEVVTLFGPQAGFYFARVSYVDLSTEYGFDDTDWQFLVSSVHFLSFIVSLTAIDTVSENVLVDAVAFKDNLSPMTFSQDNPVATFSFFMNETHFYRVTPPNEGYRPMESDSAAGQIGNPSNLMYGNPREIDMSILKFARFSFVDTFTVTGHVRDRWTGQNIENAKLTFKATTPGKFMGKEFRKYPYTASWANTWKSESDGQFPDSMYLPRISYILTIGHADYHDYVTNTITPAATGQTKNLGSLRMTPRDNNGNHIADQWEQAYGVLALDIAGTDDLDGDGVSNLHEYLADTDPNNSTSRFFVVDATIEPEGLKLLWEPLVQGRNYAVQRADSTSGVPFWTTVAGPSAHTSFPNGWTDPNGLDRPQNIYRIKLTVP